MNENNQTIPAIQEQPGLQGNPLPNIGHEDSPQLILNPRNASVDTHDEYNRAAAAGDVLGSARSLLGYPLAPSEIQPDSLVTIHGVEMQARDAERIGLLTRNASGTYALGKNPEPSQAPEEINPAQSGIENPEPFAPEQEAKYADIADHIPADVQQRAITGFITDGDFTPGILRDVANAIPGGDTEQARELLMDTMALFEEQGHAAVSSRGINSDQFFAWAETNHRKELDKAMTLHVGQRSTKGYHQLMDTYLESLDTIAPESVLKLNLGPNVKVFWDGEQVVVKDKTGSTHSWSSAVRSGVVRFKGQKKK